MKKTNIRIEIKAKDLAKKILDKNNGSPPSVYGEEKPTGKNIPDINAKDINRERAELLETSNKKPIYTGLVKEAISELQKAEKRSGRPSKGRQQWKQGPQPSDAWKQGIPRSEEPVDTEQQRRDARISNAQRLLDTGRKEDMPRHLGRYGKWGKDFGPVDYGPAQPGGETDEERMGEPITPTEPERAGWQEDAVKAIKQGLGKFGRMARRKKMFVSPTHARLGGDLSRFRRGPIAESPTGSEQYWEVEQAIVKEAISELRKAPVKIPDYGYNREEDWQPDYEAQYGSGATYEDTGGGSYSGEYAPYGSEGGKGSAGKGGYWSQLQPGGRTVGRTKPNIEQAIVKEAMAEFKIEKQPDDYGGFQPGESRFGSVDDTPPVKTDTGEGDPIIDMGATAIARFSPTKAPIPINKSLQDMTTQDLIKQASFELRKDDNYSAAERAGDVITASIGRKFVAPMFSKWDDIGKGMNVLSDIVHKRRSWRSLTGTQKKDFMRSVAPKPTGQAGRPKKPTEAVDFDKAWRKIFGTKGEGSKMLKPLKHLIHSSIQGINPVQKYWESGKTDKFGKRTKGRLGPGAKNVLTWAVVLGVPIGVEAVQKFKQNPKDLESAKNFVEGLAGLGNPFREPNKGWVNLRSGFKSLSNLFKDGPTATRGSTFLGPAPPPKKRIIDGGRTIINSADFGYTKNIQKQAPMVGGAAGQLPKTTSMTKPANMGVNVQQPVVTGAGTMKNIEKRIAANKPKAAGAPKKTKAKRRAPK